MRLISWNVNGLRAVQRKSDLDNLFDKETFNILCIQETKASKDQLTDKIINRAGYQSFFASSVVRKGYSGVATYTNIEPKKVEYGMGVIQFDKEGRVLTMYFNDFVLLNVYFPNGGSGPERLRYKLDFYDAFLNHIETLRSKGHRIIFCGDVNTAHEEIDLARPRENEKNTGFLPEERAWLDEVATHGYIDTFRHFYPEKKDMYSYWDLKTRARDRDVGWRIDYVFADTYLQGKLKSAFILSYIMGSDHCPVGVELE